MLVSHRKVREDNESGFTLIELLVVIIIIGILAAIAIPVFLNQRQKGYDAAAKSDARNIATLEQTYLTDNSNYVAAANLAAVQLAFPDYKKSANVSDVKITYVDGAGASTASANLGFCIQTASASGNTFGYNSGLGGVQPGTSYTCP